MDSAPQRRYDDRLSIEEVGDHLDASFDGIRVDYFDDDSQMTPMLVLRVDSARTRADVLRAAFEFERKTPVRVDSVHPQKVVLRGE